MDKYDDAVAFLTEHPEAISRAWRQPTYAPGGILFKLIPHALDKYVLYQCLTTMKQYTGMPITNPILLEVMADPQIPADYHDITVNMLPAFAEYQRRMNGYVVRTP